MIKKELEEYTNLVPKNVKKQLPIWFVHSTIEILVENTYKNKEQYLKNVIQQEETWETIISKLNKKIKSDSDFL